jgi:hypothetical protein
MIAQAPALTPAGAHSRAQQEMAEGLKAEGNALFQRQKYLAAIDVSVGPRQGLRARPTGWRSSC